MGMDFEGTLTPDEFWSRMQDFEDHVRQSFEELPVFTVAQWPGEVMLGEWSSGRGPRGLMHGLPEGGEPFVHVMTSQTDTRESARTLWLRHHLPEIHDKAAHSRIWESFDAEPPVRRSVLVADSALDFDVWERENEWWAVAEVPECRILLEGRNIDPSELALMAVEDVEPYIAARNERIREQRGET